jgi:regulator of RNase E activity RraA
MSTQAKATGIAGFVIDGAVRDTDVLASGDFPIFAAGRNPCGPRKSVSGRVNSQISAGGASVNPGDLVLGDADGVVVIPREQVSSLLEAAQRKVDGETRRIAAIRAGDTRAPWLEKELRAVGMLAEGETL